MSHFAILVIGPDPEKQLAPYQENNMDDCPREFLEFCDLEDEYLQEYEAEGTEMIVMPDGRLLLPWDNEFRVPGRFGFGTGTHKAPDELERRHVPYKERYATFEQYVSDWHGYEARDAEKGRFGRWENPNQKWDWYQIGGRWSGFLKLKAGAEGKWGEKSWTNKDKADDMDRCDAAPKGAIDIEGMRNEAGAKAADEWDRARAASGEAVWEPWAHVRDVMFKGDIDAAREFYNGQLPVAAINQAFGSPFSLEPDKFLDDRATFIQDARDGALALYAYIKDGKWQERGEMLMFGMSNDKVDKRAWYKQFNEMIDGLPDDTELTVIDCHI